eukprot:gene1088-1670_t
MKRQNIIVSGVAMMLLASVLTWQLSFEIDEAAAHGSGHDARLQLADVGEVDAVAKVVQSKVEVKKLSIRDEGRQSAADKLPISNEREAYTTGVTRRKTPYDHAAFIDRWRPKATGKADVMYTGIFKEYNDSTNTPRPGALIENAVVLILYGGRFGGHYFAKYALPRMNVHFFKCFPYRLHVFYEEPVDTDELPALRRLVMNTNVTFEKVDFRQLPKGVSESDVARWKSEGVQKKFQGRGYRQMCRFWAGVVWTFATLQRYTYYLRLDTDSIIPSPVLSDPFHRLIASSCQYGFNRLKGENPHVTTKLWETTLDWMRTEPSLTPGVVERVKSVALKNGVYWGPMYYNNFEVGTFALKNHGLYQSFFRFADSHEPFGIFRYRWGDAPLHTIGIAAALPSSSCYTMAVRSPAFRAVHMTPVF